MTTALTSRSGSRAALPAVLVILVGGAILFQAAAVLSGAVLNKKPVAIRRSLLELPRSVGPWERVGEDAVLSPEVIEELGTELYLSRDYALNGDDRANGRLNLHIAYYTGMIDAVPHVPERCFVGGGLERTGETEIAPLRIETSGWWEDPDFDPATAPEGAEPLLVAPTRGGEYVRMPALEDGTLGLNVSTFCPPADPEYTIDAGYFFIANGQVTPRAEWVRLLAFNLDDEYAYYCKVQLTLARPDRGVTREEFLQQAEDFLNHMLPDIMLCMPDWPEVLQRSAEAGS